MVDSGTGFHWAAVDSFRVQRNPPPEGKKALIYQQVSGSALDSGGRVASQKFAAVASEVARLALPHTNPAKRDPYNQ